MVKIRVFVLVLLGFCIANPKGFGVVKAGTGSCVDGEYVVSAYYSPLPGQDRYATGTYTGDIRLNGGGVTTASGVKVADAPGAFLAAPSCFEFGEIVELNGMGNYIILDRGGAIKGKRLDLWLGYGDEGLNAALQWGKRSVDLKSLGINADVDLAEKAAWVLPAKKSYLKVIPDNPFELLKDLEIGDSGASIEVLQQLLKDLNYYEGDIDGYFNLETKKALLTLEEDQDDLVEIDLSPLGRLGEYSIAQIDAIVIQTREKYLEDLPETNIGSGAKGNDVLNLQKALRKLGYNVEFTSEYDELTIKAVTDYQIDKGLIDTKEHLSAGYFGKDTQESIKESLENAFPENITTSSENSDTFEYLTLNDTFEYQLSPGMTDVEVRRLQEVLRMMHLFKVEPTGYYGPLTQHAVTKMQLKFGVISDKSDAGSGYVGPKTRFVLNNFLNNYYKRQHIETRAQAHSTGELFSKSLKKGDSGVEVFELQKFLQDQGYFEGLLLTKYYGEVTYEGLAQFKLNEGLIENLSEKDAGTFDDETRDYINSKFK